MAKITARPIPGFSKYSVTEDGRVFGPLKELRQFSDRRGYLRVWVYRIGKRFELYVHRAVASVWVNGDQSLTVNHKDSNKQNNYADNLEWVSNRENIKHSFLTGARPKETMGKKKGRSYAISPSVLPLLFGEIKAGKSIRRVASQYNVGRATLQYQYKHNGGVL